MKTYIIFEHDEKECLKNTGCELTYAEIQTIINAYVRSISYINGPLYDNTSKEYKLYTKLGVLDVSHQI